MTEKCDLNRCGNAAAGSIEDDMGSFSFCDAHFDAVTSVALHAKLSLADAVQAVARAENIEDNARLRPENVTGILAVPSADERRRRDVMLTRVMLLAIDHVLSGERLGLETARNLIREVRHAYPELLDEWNDL
jgi:hypothetical protein